MRILWYVLTALCGLFGVLGILRGFELLLFGSETARAGILPIEQFPVWQYALDEEDDEGQDETTVRPIEPDSLDFSQSSYFIRAVFTLVNGLALSGLVTVCRLPDNGVIKIEGDHDQNADRQPVIITSVNSGTNSGTGLHPMTATEELGTAWIRLVRNSNSSLGTLIVTDGG